jgi:putative DNA primase/helicase
VFRVETGQFEGHRPENYARRHIGVEYLPTATCPKFERLIASMFRDRTDADAVIMLVQEWAGAALAISSLSREQRRALILVGPSRTGKTELAKIFARLLGDPLATPSVAEISERFGLSSMYGAAAWIRDDAINEGDKLDPQRFKTIVTGEAVNIEIKNRSAIPNVRLNIPVLLTANTLPRARDGSDAIFNRSIILTMTNVIDETAAHQARIDLGGSGGPGIGTAIFDDEGPGILNWALEGLRRLRARGLYDIPESVGVSIRRFKDDNNPVAEWAREAVEADPWSKVARRDLTRAYNGWELEQDGDEARSHGGRWLLPKLRAQVKGLGDMQAHSGARYITGIKLSKAGLATWESYGKASPRNGPGGFAMTQNEVNQVHKMDDKNKGNRSENDPPF